MGKKKPIALIHVREKEPIALVHVRENKLIAQIHVQEKAILFDVLTIHRRRTCLLIYSVDLFCAW